MTPIISIIVAMDKNNLIGKKDRIPWHIPSELMRFRELTMGKPIITTNTPGCASTVENGVNGILCRPMSISDLVSSMEKIINITHKDRIIMGLKSRELVERKFDEKVVINKYLESVL